MRAMEVLLSRIMGAADAGDGYIGLCPTHDDRNPSLSIAEGDDGRVLLHCHAGCATESVLGALGLEWADLFADGDGLLEVVADLEKLLPKSFQSVKDLDPLKERFGGIPDGLAALGYDPGVVDGVNGAATTAAVRAFQYDEGLTETGTIDETLIAELRSASQSRSREAAGGTSDVIEQPASYADSGASAEYGRWLPRSRAQPSGSQVPFRLDPVTAPFFPPDALLPNRGSPRNLNAIGQTPGSGTFQVPFHRPSGPTAPLPAHMQPGIRRNCREGEVNPLRTSTYPLLKADPRPSAHESPELAKRTIRGI